MRLARLRATIHWRTSRARCAPPFSTATLPDSLHHETSFGHYDNHNQNQNHNQQQQQQQQPPDSNKQGLLFDIYNAKVRDRNVQADPHQLEALASLQALREDLMRPPPVISRPVQQAASFWQSLFKPQLPSILQPSAPLGVYLHGGVGCGKTFLMNLFYDSYDGPYTKQKIHFHKFMLRIHQDMHAARHSGVNVADAVLPRVIESTMSQGQLLCLDEFQVTDVADALILQRLFQGLWKEGCVLVATSNRPPDDLYYNGLQRDRFLPFIDSLKHRTRVVGMWESETDYRLIQKITSGAGQVYFCGKQGLKEVDALFYHLVGQSAIAPTALTVQSRKVRIPRASLKNRIARFSFPDLCQAALGAADYLLIGQHFHTVVVDQIPALTVNEVNWLRRFITFVDACYENQVKLILHAQTSPTPRQILDSSSSTTAFDEVFAFDRTCSRLEEMSSIQYLQKKWAGCQSTSPAALLSNQHATVCVDPFMSDAGVH
jgi:peroxisome-assembly ATPase